MNLELAKIYGTPGQKFASAAQEESLEKQAQVELFAKLAAQNGIDLGQLSDDQVSNLWGETFGTKLAGEMPPQFAAHMKGKGEAEKEEGKEHGEKDEKEKKEKEEHEKKAAAEFAALQASKDENQKLAEADRAGRIMAHAMVQELNSINQASTKEAAATTAAPAPAAAAPAVTSLAKYASEKAEEMAKKKEEKKEEGKEEPRKEASAIERLAIDRAFEIVATSGFDVKEAGEKLAALLAPGIPESTKIAAAQDLGSAVEIRALEFLEAAGYPVTWN